MENPYEKNTVEHGVMEQLLKNKQPEPKDNNLLMYGILAVAILLVGLAVALV